MKNNENQLLQHPYQPNIKLADFEGPLDLLLHLIRQSEMDIYDIPIAEITGQYMQYLRQMQRHQLEVAGEYFVMAATLMAIKSQMLLPKPPVSEDEEPIEEDPREELVEQLLEYQRYKQAAEKLKDKEAFRQKEFTRTAMAVPSEFIHPQTAPGTTIEQLKEAFEQVLKKHQSLEPETATVAPEKTTVEQRIRFVMQRVSQGAVAFEELFADLKTRDNLVTTFLAVLELAKHRRIVLHQAARFAPLILTPGKLSEED